MKAIKLTEIFILALFFYAVFSWFLKNNSVLWGYQEYLPLAKSFLEARLDIPADYDASFYNGKYYWPLGPFPAFLLLPFILLLGEQARQGHLALFLHVANFILIFKLSQKMGLKNLDRFWYVLAFFAGSIYLHLGINPTSWYLAHLVALSVTLLALISHLFKKNPLLIGSLLSFAGMTRTTNYLLVLFFLLEILRKKSSARLRIKSSFFLLLPIFTSFLILLTYNLLRFDHPFEFGYTYQKANEVVLPQLREGLFSISHLPANLYYFLIKSPEPVVEKSTTAVLKFPYLHVNPWGLGILFTSPILILLFFLNFKESRVQNALATIFITLIPILTYYGIGWYQYGYRYALDIYPFLYFLLATVLLPKIALRTKLLISLSSLFNLYLLSFSF